MKIYHVFHPETFFQVLHLDILDLSAQPQALLACAGFLEHCAVVSILVVFELSVQSFEPFSLFH